MPTSQTATRFALPSPWPRWLTPLHQQADFVIVPRQVDLGPAVHAEDFSTPCRHGARLYDHCDVCDGDVILVD